MIFIFVDKKVNLIYNAIENWKLFTFGFKHQLKLILENLTKFHKSFVVRVIYFLQLLILELEVKATNIFSRKMTHLWLNCLEFVDAILLIFEIQQQF